MVLVIKEKLVLERKLSCLGHIWCEVLEGTSFLVLQLIYNFRMHLVDVEMIYRFCSIKPPN